MVRPQEELERDLRTMTNSLKKKKILAVRCTASQGYAKYIENIFSMDLSYKPPAITRP